MSSPLERLRSKSNILKSKRSVVLAKLFELEKSLTDAFEGLKIYGQSKDATLSQEDRDDWTYGHLYFSNGELKLAYRSTQEDYFDAMNKVPEEHQGYSIKHISMCSAEWLEKLTVEKVIDSLTKNLEEHLDEMNDTADQSILMMAKVFESQAAQLNSDTVDALKHFDSDLIKVWSTAHSLITIEPADSITKSSSYIESICKKILADLSTSLPNKQDMTSLINECVKALGLSEDSEADNDLKPLVSGIKSICQSIGTMRTHFGTAHGSSPGAYRVNEHYARLINNAAATISVFLIQRHKDNAKKSQP